METVFGAMKLFMIISTDCEVMDFTKDLTNSKIHLG